MDTTTSETTSTEEILLEVNGTRAALQQGQGDVLKPPAKKKSFELIYGVTDRPPWYACVFLGFQHYLAIFVGNLGTAFLIADSLCMKDDPAVKAEMLGVQFFLCGVITMCQVVFGVRLPIVQCSTVALLIPTISYFSLEQNACPLIKANCSLVAQSKKNVTCIEKYSPEYEHLWQSRLVIIQGSLMVAAVMEILLGLTGCISFLLRYIGPLSICPPITLIGLSLFKASADYGAQNWPVCLMTLILLVAFSQYLNRINIPFPSYKKGLGCTVRRYPLFKMLPVFLAILLSWFLCYILTVTNAIPNDPQHWAYGGRTDKYTDVLQSSAWFTLFYPGKYGWPTVDLSLVLGLMAGFMASILESIGDYHACARMTDVPVPPNHAINRGIMIEGLGCFFCGLFGVGNGSTSASQNIGVIGITRVGSKIVVLYTGGIMIILALFIKFGLLFSTIPEPIIGAAFMVLFGTISAVGLSCLQSIDLNSPRNLFILGFALFMGLAVPDHFVTNPGSINTGVVVLDSILSVFLSTSMFVGGLIGFILDNTIPGSDEERGMQKQEEQDCYDGTGTPQKSSIYQIPKVRGCLERVKFLRYLPICPKVAASVDSKC